MVFKKTNGSNELAKTEKELADLEARRSSRVERLAAAQTELETAKAARNNHLVAGDITDEEA
jgi:hypothetical protein